MAFVLLSARAETASIISVKHLLQKTNKTYIWSKLLRYMEAATPLVAEINQYLTRLNSEQQKAVLTVAKTFAATQDDWWDEITIEQQQAIDNALAEMKAGKLIPHSAVMAKYSQWL